MIRNCTKNLIFFSFSRMSFNRTRDVIYVDLCVCVNVIDTVIFLLTQLYSSIVIITFLGDICMHEYFHFIMHFY